MPLPNAKAAWIPPEKITEYLLNPAHPVGGPKARWFLSLGYRSDKPEEMASALLKIARTSPDCLAEPTPFGTKYIVEGLIEAPNERRASVCTVWMTEPNAPQPRLITAYPSGKASHA